ncbi:hypothetical protein G9A89_005851 [Geosiphon pyriformis]|nr:hypothetical protein G9A89_005851 [Geosiphon pyriformis]
MFNGQHVRVPAMCGHFKNQYTEEPLIEFEDTSMPPTIETYQVSWADDYQTELLPPPIWEEKGKGRAKEEPQLLSLRYETLIKDTWKQALNRLDGYPHNDHEIWRMASVKAEGATPKEMREIKDNPWMPEYTGPDYPKDDFFTDDPDAFQNQYQELVPTREEQKQRLADLNTKLCDHCLIPCYFQYCDKCDLMFNLPPRILFPITKLPEPKEKVLITEDMSFQDPTEDTETEQYLVYSDLSKELELKWYSDNEKGICPKKVYDTDADLKIVLEIPISTIVQVASRYNLAKKKIDIKGEIIDAGYTKNIIVMLQNNSNRPYKIESQEKIAQAIFLPLVKILQLTPVTTREELGLTVQGINEFGSNGRGNVPVNFTEEDSDQIQDQALLFEASPEICSLADVANLYLPAKAHKHFKILIHNPTKDVIKIPEGTLVGSISADSQNPEKPQSIPDFAQLFLFCDIISQVWNLPKESYLFTPEEINKLNLGNLSTLQQMQLKVLLNQYADVFASKNEFGCTDIMKHQIDTGDAQPIKQ